MCSIGSAIFFTHQAFKMIYRKTGKNLIVVTWLALLTTPQLFAQRPMTSADVAKLKYVSSVNVSSDASMVAYTVIVPRQPMQDDDGGAWSNLYVTDLAGNARPFVTGHVSVGHPVFSADDQWIFYTSKRNNDKNTTLYRIAVDGGESLATFKHDTSIGAFDVSDDGKRVAFLAKVKTEDGVKETRDKGFDQEIYEEDWLSTMVWIGDVDLKDTSSVGKEARMLQLKGSAVDVVWSPDGKRLMVVLADSPSVDDSYMHKHIHIVDAESGQITSSIGNVGKLGQIEWSPDGEYLAYVSGEDINDPREGRLMVVKTSGAAESKELLPKLDAHINTIAWKDNQTLYWLAGDGLGSRFGTVDLQSSTKDILTPASEIVVVDFARSETDEIVFLGHSSEHPPELFTSDEDALKRLTHHNSWLSELKFAKQSPVTWKARDGLELQGVLVYPLEYDPENTYPTIMYVHGGPESHESNGWVTSYSRPGQVAAAKGFAVFYPNYRGSTGRGVKFSRMGQADAAGKEFDDLVDGVDHLIELGITDKARVGVTGGSYGGYASAWCSTFYSDRFAASAMFVGISDNVSKVGTTDIPDEMFLVHHMKRLWDDWDYFLERSPIRYVERNKTATLILHGKNDPRVHPSQSLELHRHLKTLGQAPVRLVLYEGEGHGNRKAAARLDYNLRMLRWMEHFLIDQSKEAPDYAIDYKAALGTDDEK